MAQDGAWADTCMSFSPKISPTPTVPSTNVREPMNQKDHIHTESSGNKTVEATSQCYR